MFTQASVCHCVVPVTSSSPSSGYIHCITSVRISHYKLEHVDLPVFTCFIHPVLPRFLILFFYFFKRLWSFSWNKCLSNNSDIFLFSPMVRTLILQRCSDPLERHGQPFLKSCDVAKRSSECCFP